MTRERRFPSAAGLGAGLLGTRAPQFPAASPPAPGTPGGQPSTAGPHDSRSVAAPARDGGAFGTWTDDPPAFSLRDDPPEHNVWHQIGNDRLTATAHADGHVTVHSTDAGTVRLSSADRGQPELQGGRWAWLTAAGQPIAATASPARATWQVGSASWTIAGDGWTVTRRAWVPFGRERTLRVDMEIIAGDEAHRGGTLLERWAFQPFPIVLGGLMAPITRPPPGYAFPEWLGWYGAFTAAQVSRSTITALRHMLGRALRLQPVAGTEPRGGLVVLAPWLQPPWLHQGRPSRLAAIPHRVVVAALSPDRCAVAVRRVPARSSLAAPGTAVLLRTTLPPGERASVSYAVGLLDPDTDVRNWVVQQRRSHAAESGQAWRETFCLRSPDAALDREMAWHAGMLRSAQVAEPVFGSSYVAQGSAYAFVNGLQGAVRDYAHFMIPLCLVDPAGARSMLFTMLAMQHRDGSLAYAHTGAGWRTSALIHPESTDLPLCLLWAAVEYIRMTGDAAVLDQRVPWHPGEQALLRQRVSAWCRCSPLVRHRSMRRKLEHNLAGQAGDRAAVGTPPESDTIVARRLLLAWQHLDEAIGRGPHGLIRIGSGDWNDPLRSMAASRRAFRSSGESVYNSAMAAYVLPKAAQLLAHRDPAAAQRMRWRADDLQVALRDAWTGRWFLRGWDGLGGPLGHDRIFLDSNAWCLIAQAGTNSQRHRLIAEIASRLDDPSPIGAKSLDRPVTVRGGILAPGWDTNGGVWPALNALLAWGYALHEPDRALALLRRMTFAAHAHAYPGQWIGIWSGPDAFNAHCAQNPGGTYVQPATPMAEFPVMNANAHAGPLLALAKVLGLETEASGLAVRRAGVLRDWQLATTLGAWHVSPSQSSGRNVEPEPR